MRLLPAISASDRLRRSQFLWVAIGAALLIANVACGGSSHANSSTNTPPPSFKLSISPSAVILQQAQSTTLTLVVTGSNGFNSGVALSASNLPGGVTATFSPANTTSSSVVSLTVTGSASTGSASITIAGSGGGISSTTQINLTVLAAAPPNSLPASFFALNNVAPTDDPTADGMVYGAVGHPIRLAWPYIEQSRGNFDFSFYDQYAAIAPREGPNGIVAVMDLTLGMTPGWAIADQSTCRQLPDPNGPTIIGCQAPPDNLQDWKDFITALVQHYNGSSPSRPYIKYYEIWNEWNANDANNGFWIGPITQLVALEQTACSIIHAQLLNFSFVLTPSTVGSARTPNDQAPQQLQSFLQAGGGNCVDGVSFHGNLGLRSLNPYPQPGEGCTQAGCNGTILQIANSYRQVLNLNGMQSVPLFDTEGGLESANVTDIDQRAAWLAQFYILQAGLFNTDQLQWVSWFTWGTPGVAGNIETGNRAPDPAGVGYNQVFNWIFGRFPSACSQSGTVWTCDLTGSGGYQAVITWDDSQTCNNGTCTTSSQTAPSWAVKMRDLSGQSAAVNGGSQIQIGLKPIILENQ